MEILKHHVLNLELLLRGVSENDVHLRLRHHVLLMARWSIDGSGEPAYPGLQTEAGFNNYLAIKERMYKAIISGKYKELDDEQTDELCGACGNLTKNGCRLKGKFIRINPR